MSESATSVSSEFPTPDRETWVALVERTLKGKPFEKAMSKATYNGFDINALSVSRPEDLGDAVQGQQQGWHIASPHWNHDPKVVNKDLLTDLERGASAISVSLSSGGLGIEADDLEAALEGVYLDMVPIELVHGEDFIAGANALRSLIDKKGHGKNEISGNLGADPIGNLARYGLSSSVDKLLADAVELSKQWGEYQPQVSCFAVDGTVVANAAGSEAQELAFAFSCAAAYLRAMEQGGIPLETAVKQIQFRFSAGADLWTTVAKFRVARKLWKKITLACGVDEAPMQLNAYASISAVSKRDPWVNILRGTAACFAAAVGGADTIATWPHDIMLANSNEFSRRIARNIQIVLQEESSLGQVIDPAAGSYAIENLTKDLEHATETIFKSLEAEGGVVAALRSGSFQQSVTKVAEKKLIGVRSRKIPVTGVSEFPDITEASLPLSEGGHSKVRPEAGLETVLPLSMQRAAAPFEALRETSDLIENESGNRPRIYMANLGSPADFTARSTFAKNFFESGGIEAISGSGGNSIDDIDLEYKKSGAPLAIICGTDVQYESMATQCASALVASGCRSVIIAGSPTVLGDLEGIDDYAFMGADVISVLERSYEALSTTLGESS